MKKIYLIITVNILFIFGCSSQKCDNAFENKMIRYINTVEKYNKGNALTTDSLYNTLGYLSFVTGYETQMYLGEVNMYLDQKQYRTDIRKWKQWLKENKCMYSLQEADSIYLIKFKGKE